MRDDEDEAPAPTKKSGTLSLSHQEATYWLRTPIRVGLTVFGAGTTKPMTGKRKLVETETEIEVHSEAATGNLNDDEAALPSDLSPVEEVVKTTPRPKKKPRGDEDAVPANTVVNRARRAGPATGTNTKTHTSKNKSSNKEPSAKAM